MISEEQINRIRSEELIRFEIKKELEATKTESKSKWWAFLNSNFGLFILSSIVLSLISWGYSTLQTHSTIAIQNEQNAQKILTEMNYRLLLIKLTIDESKKSQDSTVWPALYDIEDAFHGKTITTLNDKTSETDFSPVFQEFVNRGLHSLFWEYQGYSDKIEKQEYTVMKTLIDFDVYLNKSIVNDLQNKGSLSRSTIDTLDEKLKIVRLFLDEQGH